MRFLDSGTARPNSGGHSVWKRLLASLIAGSVAIAINTFILLAADWIPLATAHGGLLKLIKPVAAGPLHALGVADAWTRLGLPAVGSATFKTGFHVAVGLAMAVFYAFVVDPALRGPSWRKGFLYAVFAWLANAFIVLPLTGQGIAGSRNLTLAGMVYYAFAHTVFFVLQAILYGKLVSRGKLVGKSAGRA